LKGRVSSALQDNGRQGMGRASRSDVGASGAAGERALDQEVQFIGGAGGISMAEPNQFVAQ
jgi:hypothetical protein